MTLKRYLSTKHAINAVLELLEHAHDDESALKSLRLLACIIIQNKSSQKRAELLDLFESIDGYTRLKTLLAQRLQVMQASSTRRLFA